MVIALSGICMGLLGCQNKNTVQETSAPILSARLVFVDTRPVFVDMEALVRAHPLQQRQVPTPTLAPLGQSVPLGHPPNMVLATNKAFALEPTRIVSPQSTPKSKFAKPVNKLVPTKNVPIIEDARSVTLRFGQQKQRLWDAELQSDRLVALQEADTKIALQPRYADEGLLESLEARYRALKEIGNSELLSDQQSVMRLSAQIAIIEQVNTQIPGVDLAIAVLEKQLEELPSRGISNNEEMARLKAQVERKAERKIEEVYDKDSLRRVVNALSSTPGSYTDNVRLEMSIAVYRAYRQRLDGQVEQIRDDATQWQLAQSARQRAEGEKSVQDRLRVKAQMAPPGLSSMLPSIVSLKENANREIARFNAEKKRLGRVSPILNSKEGTIVVVKKVENVQQLMLKSEKEMLLQRKKQQDALQQFIRQDCAVRLQEIAKSRGIIVYTDKKVKNTVSYLDRTPDFLRWMWEYQQKMGVTS
jgi:hypothetical protein